jgi:hypothetical protein
MKHVVIHLCEEFHGFAAVAPQDRIVEDKHSDPALAGKLPQGRRYQNGQEQEKLPPIEGRVAEETVISILGSSMVVML